MSDAAQEKTNTEIQPTPEFLARAKRVEDALNLRKPDRVPVAPLVVHYYPNITAGVSNKEAMYSYESAAKVWKEAVLRHDWDMTPALFASLQPAGPLEALGMTQIQWPGGDLADDKPFQWVEGEYMKQDEYDEILADPNGFAVKKLWPRISKVLAPVAGMAELPPPPLAYLSNAYTLPSFIGEMLSFPGMKDILKKLLEAAEMHEKNAQQTNQYKLEMARLGYPTAIGAVTTVPFDWISDTLRGLVGTSMDMYQAPDKLLALIDYFTPIAIMSAVMMASQSDVKRVFIPLHRGAGGFMSNEQFERFYWPGFKAVMLGLIDAGLTPCPLFEGDYTPRLEFLKELPPGKIIGHFDHIDRRKAKEMIGDVMCFWGNVPASLMCAGTPQQVKDDVRELIDIFGDNGGLIIDSTMGIPDESKPENVQALTEAVQEFGVY